MKEARHLGYARLHDIAGALDIWSCPKCNSIFHAQDKCRGKTHICMDCKEKILLFYPFKR
ncbi:MAG: hypothetical protein ACOC5T_03875 [Elusimicrobiota bacterium]